jgi:hexosaminidase
MQHSIIPEPAVFITTEGICEIQASLPFAFNIAKEHPSDSVVQRLQHALERLQDYHGISLEPVSPASKPPKVVLYLEFVLPAAVELPPDGYELIVAKESITLRAPAEQGMVYGLRTLLQLIKKVEDGGFEIPCCKVRDYPRFPWRGLLLDVARHMFPLPWLHELIDRLADLKMNRLHLHLVDDQGWRIEIEQFPRLTEIGAFRAQTPIPSNRHEGDGQRYGGFYTKKELEELVAYADDRFITIVPEIEMPGHAQAALAAYPHLGCTGMPMEVWTEWGISPNVFCIGKPETIPFLKKVLEEVMEVFPSPWIHIGGDECPTERWESCPDCQKLMQQEGLSSARALQSRLNLQIGEFLAANNRTLIGWDEILDGPIPENAVVMSWRGTEGGMKAASNGHPVVMCPTTHCYLDYYQNEDTRNEPPAIGGFLPMEKVYDLEPVPQGLPKEAAAMILGAQVNLWTEYIPTTQQADYMLWPRTAALAEVAWSPAGNRNWKQFSTKISASLFSQFQGVSPKSES